MVITITISPQDTWLIDYLDAKMKEVGIHKKSPLIKKLLWDLHKQEQCLKEAEIRLTEAHR